MNSFVAANNSMSSHQPATSPSDRPLPESTDIVVVGGGIVGICTALFLAERGVRVCVCEKGRIAGEQSSRNWGWVRQMGRDPIEMPLAIESLAVWRSLQATHGIDAGFRQTGITYLCRNDSEVRKAERWAQAGEEFGLEQNVLNRSQIADLMPGAAADFRMGLHTASDGGAEPDLAVPAMAQAASELGATILTGCAVRGVETSGGGVSAALTERGPIRCDGVVVAGGVWTRLFLGNLGIDFPQMKILATVARIGPVAGIPDMPVGGGDFAFRQRLDGGFTVALRNAVLAPIVPDSFRLLPQFLPTLKRSWREMRLSIGRQFATELATPRRWRSDEPTTFERTRILDPAPVRSLNRRALKTLPAAFPAFSGARIVHEWAGMIDVTPDEIPVMDSFAECPGLYVASGFSGHGFGIGPGAGLLVAQLVTGERPCVDPHPFRLLRLVKPRSKGSGLRSAAGEERGS